MRVRPNLLPLFAYLLAAVALVFPVQLAFMYQQVVNTPQSSLPVHAFLCYGFVSMTLINAYWLFNAAPLVRWSVPTLSISIVGYYIYLYHIGMIQQPGVIAAVFTLFLAINFFFLDSDSRFILDHPELRWWRIPIRKKVSLSAFVSPFRGQGFSTETFDLSSGGAFFPHSKSNSQSNSGVIRCEDLGKALQIGDQVSIRITVGSLRTLRLKGKLVRCEDNAIGSYPPGFAVQFQELDRQSKKTLETFLNSVD